jgi:hypothetical protein
VEEGRNGRRSSKASEASEQQQQRRSCPACGRRGKQGGSTLAAAGGWCALGLVVSDFKIAKSGYGGCCNLQSLIINSSNRLSFVSSLLVGRI